MPPKHRNQRAWLLLLAVQLINGCNTPVSHSVDRAESGDPARPSATSICAIRQLAFDKTLEMKNIRRPSIVAGCEGPYKSHVTSPEEHEQINSENQSPPPQSVLARGVRHEKLYQQLKAHGVPDEVLSQLIDTAEFSAAADEISAQRVISWNEKSVLRAAVS